MELSKPEHEQEEWGGWKFVSDMLDNPNENGIYPTSKCYKQLYDFVMEQKAKAREQGRKLGRLENYEFDEHKARTSLLDELLEEVRGKWLGNNLEEDMEHTMDMDSFNQALSEVEQILLKKKV